MTTQNNFKDFSNKFSLTKTLRFELEKQNDRAKEIKNFDGVVADTENLIIQFKQIQENFVNIFLYKKDYEENEQINFKKKRVIKYNWLRTYTKNKFYEETSNKNEKSYALSSLSYLPDEFSRWIAEWSENTERLKELTETKKEAQRRRSEIAFVLRRFLKRQNFEFIKEFANAVMDVKTKSGIDDDEKLKDFRELLNKTFQNLKACESEYLPAQSGGVLCAKASLNYYTINKTPREYGELKKQKEGELKRNLPNYIYERKVKGTLQFTCTDDWLIKIGLGTDIKEKTLDEAYVYLKNWKAKQTSAFIEAVAKKELSVKNFREQFPLFDASNENFQEFYELTEALNGAEGEEAKIIAQQRGAFLNKPNQDIQTKNYYELCELFKRIAMKRGKIITEIKGLENEEVQSQILNHWAVIAEKNNTKYALLIPRGADENHKKAHEFLEQNSTRNNTAGGDVKVYHFKSLTFRALEKLCWKNEAGKNEHGKSEYKNTFIPEISKEIESIPKYKEEWRNENDEWKLIAFYQNVLKTNYAKKYLDLVDFGGLQEVLNNKHFKTLQDFESALEKVCYVKVPICFTEEEYQHFLNDYSAKAFQITTRSIAGKKKANAHAKIWWNFWSGENKDNHYITRINPEMSIFYREALDTSEGNRNRYSKEQFTLAITITLNATTEKTNLSFKTVEDIKQNINNFNERFKKKFSGEWVYGIDRGLKELATLNVVKFSNKKNEFAVSKPEKFAEIPVYRLKDENAFLEKDGKIITNVKGENRKVIDNISEVLEKDTEPDAGLFKKQTVSSIDLTQAKLIKEHIILNGDRQTYLKLKELSAKRRIFELFSTSKIDKNAQFSGKNVLSLGGYEIYWFTAQQKKENQKTNIKQVIKNNLQKYLNTLDEKNKFFDEETIQKINHYRDAITANMVGILYHLQKTVGLGYIALENLDTVREQPKEGKERNKKEDKKMIEEHFEQSNENISRRLEWALYKKFANDGFVPPQIKESIFLRDEFAVHQMGILKFVKVGGTSSNCPNCGKESGKTDNHFVCYYDNSCEFSTKENETVLEKNLHNSDEVGAYNIAKNAFDSIYE